VTDGIHRSLVAEVAVESLDRVLDELAAFWSEAGDTDARVRFAFETAVAEIAGNVIEHTVAAGSASGRHFTLDLRADATLLTAVFRDDGLPAEIDLSAITMATEDDESGRGRAGARAAVGRGGGQGGDGGKVWALECRRP